ncbi:hypothetical protein DFS33DRAFT_1400594 [Desarmillaria ectypa]|nr:hypothetical protein DFS33DRAFT_1400594 [Desarmillaria ectypa]
MSKGRAIVNIRLHIRNHKKKREITNGLNADPIASLTVPSVDGKNVAIKDPKYIGSYNWVDSPSPTILVPGSPRIWRNKSTPFTICPDSGKHFCDQNGYRLPSTPLLPILVAVDKIVARSDASAISIDWPSVDFITDRNGLRKLLEWVSGKKQSFRIDLQLAGSKTVLCNRWEPQSRLKVFGGYGYNFEDAVTRAAPGCERSSAGHHRIVTYDLCGLTMVVRFEVDACHVPHGIPSTSTDFLSAQLASMDPSESATSTHTVDPRTTLTVVPTGKPVANESVIELTTRKVGNSIRLKDKYQQLYFSQTPELIIDVQRRTIESLEFLEGDIQQRLGALGRALSDIQDLVVRSGTEGRLSLIGRDKELLVFERVSTASCLPENYLRRFVTSG